MNSPLEVFSLRVASPSRTAERDVIETAPVRLSYSALGPIQTALPEGVRPPSLLTNSTGSLLLGDQIFQRRYGVRHVVEGSIAFVKAVAQAIPLNKDDEELVGAAVATTLSKLVTRPLRRRATSNG